MGKLTDTETISFLDLLEPKSTNELCRGWSDAVKNDCGVFVDNRRDYKQGQAGKKNVRLEVALLYPYIYYSIGFDVGSYGYGSPCTEYADSRISVHDHDVGVDKMRSDCLGIIDRNLNIDKSQKTELKKMMNVAIDDFAKDAR